MHKICLECGEMFNCGYPGSWARDFCPDCLKEIWGEDQRDGERDERGEE